MYSFKNDGISDESKIQQYIDTIHDFNLTDNTYKVYDSNDKKLAQAYKVGCTFGVG